jgi:hypothetical protein
MKSVTWIDSFGMLCVAVVVAVVAYRAGWLEAVAAFAALRVLAPWPPERVYTR